MNFFELVVVVVFAVVTTTSLETPITTIEDLTESGSRIISGEVAVPGQFPWQVFTKNFKTRLILCAGVLICDRWVLTAAHCANNATRFSMYLGSVNKSQPVESGRIVVNASRYIIHEKYNRSGLLNDIALIYLDTKVKFTKNIQPIRLSKSYTGANLTLTVSGWGRTGDGPGSSTSVLNYVNVTSITNKECAKVYGSRVIIDSTLCCRGRPNHSTCKGDSGGPLVQKTSKGWELVGVVSFTSGAGCESGHPSGYARTESHLEWIKKHINGTCKLP